MSWSNTFARKLMAAMMVLMVGLPMSANADTCSTPGTGPFNAVMLTVTQTICNKTLDASNVFQGTLSSPTLTGTLTGTYSLGGTPTLVSPIISGTITGTYTIGGTPSFPNPSFSGTASGSLTGLVLTTPTINVNAPSFTIRDNTDTTKQLRFNLSGITTATTRTLTVPDANSTLVDTTSAQTISGKTLTTPTIASILNTGTITLPTATDTLVGRATTDTLTNKTISSPVFSGTISGIYALSGTPTIGAVTFSSTVASSKSCAAGFTRVTPNFCKYNSQASSSGLTPDNTCHSIDFAGTWGVPSSVTVVESDFIINIVSNNAIAQRRLLVTLYADSGCATAKSTIDETAREQAAVAATALLTIYQRRTDFLAANAVLYYKAQTIDGSTHAAYFAVAGYYD